MANWIATLTGETRAQILHLLRRSRLTITALAERLRLSDNAVRTQIAVLERDGIVERVDSQRDTGGKPARVYRLTDQGEDLFPKAYAVVLDGLLSEIARTDGPERVRELLRAVGRRAAGRDDRPASLEGRAAAAAVALQSLGGDIEPERVDSGWRLRGYACPLSAVSAKHAEVCALAKALVEEITGQPVVEECDRSGRPRCAFRIGA